ncbi:MAG: sulfatase-like hydrolase/transferase [Acidimicrobiales bacterium]|nr:sulfatase-like hydrolase/transferase [Acidimicrobiales bacterium]
MADPGGQPDSPSWWRVELVRLLELFALCALAFAQPLLEIYGKAGNVFVNSELGGFGVVGFALVLVFVPPILLWLGSIPFRVFSPQVELVVHRVLLGLLVVLFVTQFVNTKSVPTVAWAVGLVAGGLFLWSVFRFPAVQAWVRYLAIAPPLFLALFVFASDATPIIFQGTGAPKLDVTIASPAPVVFLLFDELPLVSLLDGSGQIDSVMFPNFAELAKETTWFRNTVTVATYTTQAVPSLLSGTVQTSGSPPIYANYPKNLFTMLGGRMQMNVVENVTHLCPDDLCTRFGAKGSDFSGILGHAADNWIERFEQRPERREQQIQLDEFQVDHNPARFDAFMTGMFGASPETLHFIHSLVPHFPWEFFPSGYTYAYDHPTGAFGVFWPDETTIRLGRIRHLLQVQYADRQLGRIMTQLKNQGIWDKAIVVVTSDHGFGFQPGHSMRGVSNENLHETLWIPLFIKGPGMVPGTVNEQFVTSLDVLPTIADMLDAKVPWEFTGRSIFEGPSADPHALRIAKNPLNELQAGDDGFVVVDVSDYYAKVVGYPAAGQGIDELRVFRNGPYASLVGLPAPAQPPTPTREWVDVSAPAEQRVAENNGTLPALIHGFVHPADATIAISLNGTIVGVPSIAPTGEFYWLLPDSKFVAGVNEIAYWLVTGPESNATLKRLSVRELAK